MTKPSEVLKKWISNLKFFSEDVKNGFFIELGELIKEINAQPNGSGKFNQITKKFQQRIQQIPFPETPWYEEARIRDEEFEEFGFMKLVHEFINYYKPILENYVEYVPKFLNHEYPEYLSRFNAIDQDNSIKLKKKSILKVKLRQKLMKNQENITEANKELKKFVKSIGETDEYIKYDTYTNRIKNSKNYLQSNYKKLASELSSKYENIRYANGFLLAIFDYLEGNPLDNDVYFKQKYNANGDMFIKWKGNRKSLKENLEKYPNMKVVFDWIHNNEGVMYYRHKFSHNRDDIPQDKVGIIKILGKDGESIIEEKIDDIAGYTQNLWFILWILCLSNLLILDPLFEIKNTFTEISTKFDEFKSKLNKVNKRLQQNKDIRKMNKKRRF
jgi:hypothetical protein